MAPKKKNDTKPKAKSKLTVAKKKQKNEAISTVPDALEKASAKAKAKATQKGEPYIQVLGVDIDPVNPTFGAFTLDWNSIFVDQLKTLGFSGVSEEDIIDQWFRTVCHHILQDTYASYQAQIPGNGRRVRTAPIGKDRTEIS